MLLELPFPLAPPPSNKQATLRQSWLVQDPRLCYAVDGEPPKHCLNAFTALHSENMPAMLGKGRFGGFVQLYREPAYNFRFVRIIVFSKTEVKMVFFLRPGQFMSVFQDATLNKDFLKRIKPT